MDHQEPLTIDERDEGNGRTVLVLKLRGKKSAWEPGLRELAANPKFAGSHVEKSVQKICDTIQDDGEKNLNAEIPYTEPKVPEDAITSLGEIPQALAHEDNPAIRLVARINGIERDVVLLGETHVATEGESKAARRIIPFFRCIGVEGVNVADLPEGKIFFWFLKWLMLPLVFVLNLFSREKRSKKNVSSIEQIRDIDCALRGDKVVVRLEDGWRPNLRMRAFFVLFPLSYVYSVVSTMLDTAETVAAADGSSILRSALIVVAMIAAFKMPVLGDAIKFVFSRVILGYVFGLGPSREKYMAKSAVAFLEGNDAADRMLIVTGKAHTKRIAKILQRKYSFVQRGWEE